MFRALVIISAVVATPAFAASPTQRLCGWIENPTPGNWWLTDRRGEWIIDTQGGHHAEGDLPDFGTSRKYWVATQPNGHGYGCACINAVVNARTKEVMKIVRTNIRPLLACRRDRALKEPKQ